MASLTLEDLFEDSRVTQWDWTLLLVIFYTPIGIVLLLIRVFALIQFYIAFMYIPHSSIRKYMLRICGSVLGVITYEKHLSKTVPHEKAYWVSNHCSPFDWVVLQSITSGSKSVVFPECDTTNGKCGLLKFQRRVFEQLKQNSHPLSIQPIALTISRHFPPFSISALDSSIWTDIFFLLFSPYTTFHIRFLEPTQCQEEEDISSFISRVESMVAGSLGLSSTSYTAKDKEELVKRRRITSQQPVLVRQVNSRLQSMASQVKEVLPHVPMSTIISDLGRTNSINATVANLIEGVVPFTPEQIPEPVSENVVSVASTSAAPASVEQANSENVANKFVGSSPSKISASSFGKSVQERGLSLQERKQRLLAEARSRYCEKHGLDLAATFGKDC